jgi:SpoVK/Ycf46/Vps4 family AAA+-type ATPase
LLGQSFPSNPAITRSANRSAERVADFSFNAPISSQQLPPDDLMRFEMPVSLGIEPVWAPEVAAELQSIIRERQSVAELAKAGLRPTHTVIFTGLPGVGKTLAARWLARELSLPLAVLNLGAVMSSFLGRTGANLRQVIAYASQQPCVLLLDELDAIAKRRDDNSDIGELKRLVTVLLQELDAWPSEALLIAATNHEQLIDPVVWRRFERRIAFPLPNAEQQAELLLRLLGADWSQLAASTRLAIATATIRLSPADVTQLALRAKREVIVSAGSFESRLLANLSGTISSMPLSERRQIGLELKRMKVGQREINRLTGLARETIRELAVA